MKRIVSVLFSVFLAVVLATPGFAAEATRDTVYILGGPDRPDGKFQDEYGVPDPQGWVSFAELDAVYELPHWHIDSFNAELLDSGTPNHAMWCGAYFDACGPDDPGYGNNWQDILAWFGTVPDPALPVSVYLTARLNYDTEPVYDFLHLQVARDTGWESVQIYDGNNKVGDIFVPVDVDETLVVNPDDYTGNNFDQVHLRWFFQSDGGWSDEDCLYDTDGAAQVDNITVSFAQGGPPVLVTEDDFEPGSDVHWNPSLESPFCSYAQVWLLLEDIDPDTENDTPQWAFVDDGTLCGSPGSPGVDWTYGPGGFVTHYGGEAPNIRNHMDAICSPPIAWPGSEYDAAMVSYDSWVHFEEGKFRIWHVRSSLDGGESWGGWQDDNFVHYETDPAYRRIGIDLTPYLEPNRTHIQIALGYFDMGWIWGFANTDEITPSPYIDNVAVKAFSQGATPIPDPAPEGFSVRHYPNPFNPIVCIEYTLPQQSQLTIRIYDVNGRLVKVVLDDVVAGGDGFVTWDGKNEQGMAMASGTYIYRLEAGDYVEAKRMVLIR